MTFGGPLGRCHAVPTRLERRQVNGRRIRTRVVTSFRNHEMLPVRLGRRF